MNPHTIPTIANTPLEAYQPHITRVAAQFPTTPMITILEAFSEALDYLNNLPHHKE